MKQRFLSTRVTAPDATSTREMSAVGQSFACGLTSAGALWCWGRTPGVGTRNRTTPVNIARDERFRAMVASDLGVCGVREDGDLRCENYFTTGVRQ